MSHIGKNYGVVVEKNDNTVSIFDTDSLEIIHHINLPDNITEPVDVVITPDGSTAVVLAGANSDCILQLKLNEEPPIFTLYNQEDFFLNELDISPDGQFAVAADSFSLKSGVDCYSLQDNTYKSNIQKNVEAVAISRKGNGLVLTVKYSELKLIPFFMNTSTGELKDSQQVIDSHGDSPANLTFTFDGNYVFVCNTGDWDSSARNVAVFDTKNSNNITWLGSAKLSLSPESIAVSRDGKKAYVLTPDTVEIFDFNPNSFPYLTPSDQVSSFTHGLNIGLYYGVEQIALDKTETKLFISGKGSLKAFDAQSGAELGSVQGVNSDGGIAILRTYQPPQPTRGFDFFKTL